MRIVPLVLFVVILPIAALQAQSSQVAPQGPAVAEHERMAKQLETEVMAPCCWSQQVSEHQSPAADDMRADIRKRLAAGQSHDQIIEAYVGEYGERILAVPRPQGFNFLLFGLPPLLFLATAALVIVVVRRAASRGPKPTAQEPGLAAAGSPQYSQQLDDELRDLD